MTRHTKLLTLTATLLVALAGCKDDDGPVVKEAAILGIQNAYSTDAQVISLESPKKQTVNIRVTAEQISGNYVTVVLKTAPKLVDVYNKAHGTSYKLCPSEAYTFSTDEVMLPRYNTLSSTIKVELQSQRMPDEEAYLLPIAIDSIKGDPRATISETGNVHYILFNKIVKPGPPAPMLLDRNNWKLLASPKAKPGYEVDKMFDEDINSFGYCNADEEQANPPYDFVLDLGREVTVRGLQFSQRYMTTGKPEAGRPLRNRPPRSLDRQDDLRRRSGRRERPELDLPAGVSRLQDRSRDSAGSACRGYRPDARKLPARSLYPLPYPYQLYEQDLQPDLPGLVHRRTERMGQ